MAGSAGQPTDDLSVEAVDLLGPRTRFGVAQLAEVVRAERKDAAVLQGQHRVVVAAADCRPENHIKSFISADHFPCHNFIQKLIFLFMHIIVIH